MNNVSSRQQELLSTPRWRWLGELVELWYADPLSAADGSTAEEIDAASARVGLALPVALREWFELVGNRLRESADTPATPSRLWSRDGHLAVWTENQGVWNLVVEGGDKDADPVCSCDDAEHFDYPLVRLSAALHGMLLSDTLAGAAAPVAPFEDRRGPLGRLGDRVRAGCWRTSPTGPRCSACRPCPCQGNRTIRARRSATPRPWSGTTRTGPRCG